MKLSLCGGRKRGFNCLHFVLYCSTADFSASSVVEYQFSSMNFHSSPCSLKVMDVEDQTQFFVGEASAFEVASKGIVGRSSASK